MSASLKKILFLALGGEGGGTLTEWVVEAGRAHGWAIQSTSIPGVAQRTGATSYYVECHPEAFAVASDVPPMCLAPVAGDIDLIISSELLETARAVERGLASPDRTLVISSSARALTVDERGAMGEGRWSGEVLTNSIAALSRELKMVDLGGLARREGTIVSAVMFGALAASGVLPFDRTCCEKIVSGEGGDARAAASLRGFAAGFQAITDSVQRSPTALHNAGQHKLPPDVEDVVRHGVARLRDYQDPAYAEQFRVLAEGFVRRDRAPFRASAEAARGLVLWMAYEDVIRVADLKSRRSRFEGIRHDYQVRSGQVMIVKDFLKPGVAEVADLLPPALAMRLLRWKKHRKSHAEGEGVTLNTSSVSGLLGMRLLASLRFLRRGSSRFMTEQALVARWVAALHGAFEADGRLAMDVARMPRLIKGYGDTAARGRGNFVRILETLVEPGLAAARECPAEAESLALKIESAMKAALADPEGRELLTHLGLDLPAPQEHVLRFMRPNARKMNS